jgi:hypothetical protein
MPLVALALLLTALLLAPVLPPPHELLEEERLARFGGLGFDR